MEGRNVGRGSNASGSSGTIVSRFSTASRSSGSRFSSFSMEEAMHFESLGIHDGNNGDSKTRWWEAAEEDRREHINRILVLEFYGAPSANCSIKRGDMSAVESWLKELGVGWVLSLEDGASAGKELNRDARSWIRALHQIVQTLCSVRPHFPDSDCGSVGLPGICEEEGKPVAENSVPGRYHLAQFIQETMLKMLAFVDLLVAWDSYKTEEFLSMDWDMLPPYRKLSNQLPVHHALSKASDKILMMFDSPTSVEEQRIGKEMAILLSAYKSKLCEATRSTMEKIRAKLVEDDDDSSSPQGTSDIHKVTQSVMAYIRLLWSNYLSVNVAIRDKYVPYIQKESRPFDSMIIEMVSCLQRKLASISESFPDQALKFLFLLNNTYFIQESQHFYYPSVNHKIKGHMERYLQVSWAPLLSCLSNPTPLCLGKSYSPLSKFESEFEKIYITQKQWKVPDPELRRSLRKAIIDKIVPGYTEHTEDNKVTDPKISPQELEEMLQELFEG